MDIKIILLLVAIIIFLGVIFYKLKNKNKKNENNPNIIETIVEPKVKIMSNDNKFKLPENFDELKFSKEIEMLYKNMQTHFTQFEYEELKSMLSDKIYLQYEKQMNQLKNNQKRAVRDNIELIDLKINDYQIKDKIIQTNVTIGIYEDKYTIPINSEISKENSTYESYYELMLEYSNNWKVQDLKLINSRSKKKKS